MSESMTGRDAAPKMADDAPCAFVLWPGKEPEVCGGDRKVHDALLHPYTAPAAPEPDTAATRLTGPGARADEQPRNIAAAVAENERGEDPRGKWGTDRSAVRADIAERSLQGQISRLTDTVERLWMRVVSLSEAVAKHGQRLDALEQPSYAAERVKDVAEAVEQPDPTPATVLRTSQPPGGRNEGGAAARSPEAGGDTRSLSEQNAVLLRENTRFAEGWSTAVYRAEKAEAALAAARRELGESRHKADDLEVAVRSLRRDKEAAEAEVARLRATIEAVRARSLALRDEARGLGTKGLSLTDMARACAIIEELAALGEPRNDG